MANTIPQGGNLQRQHKKLDGQQRNLKAEHAQMHAQKQKAQAANRANRTMNVPSTTFSTLESRPVTIPFIWLRTWFFSLLALLALPLGAVVFLISQTQMNQLSQDWLETSATVSSVSDEGINYTYSTTGDRLSARTLWLTEWDTYIRTAPSGDVSIKFTLCDLVAPFIVPKESGQSFSVWYNPASPNQVQCVPVTAESAVTLSVIGAGMMIVSAWILLGTIWRAAIYRVQQSKLAQRV